MSAPTSHLEYYKQHGINPVRYDTSDIAHHYQRRASLYRSLGITALTIRGANILEVAPGTGQNSLYLAQHSPASLTLVEPNPAAQNDIRNLYSQVMVTTKPELVCERLEEFDPESKFDIVICENWLGNSHHERGVLRKLSTFVADGGILVITAVSPVGMLPNMLRRALSYRLTSSTESFKLKTSILAEAFGKHLKSISDMTRNTTDWIHDNMLNPAYLGVLLTVPMALQELRGEFDLLATNPRFGSDWRWFKTLHGSNRKFNEHMLDQYYHGVHNFLDYRTVLQPRCGDKNIQLEANSFAVAESIVNWEAGYSEASDVAFAITRVKNTIDDLPKSYGQSIDEFLYAFSHDDISPHLIANLAEFSQMFGRETIYLSFEKR